MDWMSSEKGRKRSKEGGERSKEGREGSEEAKVSAREGRVSGKKAHVGRGEDTPNVRGRWCLNHSVTLQQ